MKTLSYILGICLFTFYSSLAQSEFKATTIEYGTFEGETLPLRDYENSVVSTDLSNPIVIDQMTRLASKSTSDALPIGPDPLAQNTQPTRAAREILVNFVGSFIGEAGGALPPDPTGAAGPNHYVHGVNLSIKIFDKNGNVLTGPTPLSTFLGTANDDGDPIVMYDQLADRFFVSQFRTIDDALIIGVSTSPDPTGSYFVYSFPLDSFPDYPKYAVWPNAYYLAANKFVGTPVYALDRNTMLAGGPNPTIIGFDLPGLVMNPSALFSPEPANLVGNTAPPDVPGYVVYLQDDTWFGVSFDHVKVWEIDPDFATPGNSTISAPSLIAVQPFDSAFNPLGMADIDQPLTDQKLASQSGIISYMANYRSFGGHNSFLFNFNVDVDGNNRAGIRWIELRNTGTAPWQVHQEGTWTRDDGEHRFMGSMGIDNEGNIALAYSRGSEENAVGLYFTGRLETDPLGQMSFEEQEIQEGLGVQVNTSRYGDYAQMTMDPDGETFWFTSQYYMAINQWTTRIAAFNLENIPILDIGDTSKDETDIIIIPIHQDNYEIRLTTPQDLGAVRYEVIDGQGRSIYSGTLRKNVDHYSGSFSSAALASGMYVVRIFNSGNFRRTKKVLIN